MCFVNKGKKRDVRQTYLWWTTEVLESIQDLNFILIIQVQIQLLIKFIYSEKATNFCEISTVDFSYVVTVKFTVEISQNFVAFSEYMNFNWTHDKGSS